MWWLILAVAGCGPRQKATWDRTSGGDAIEDIAVAMVLFGKVEGDRDDLLGPHLAGGHLEMEVVGSGVAPKPSSGWRVESLNPDIVEVDRQGPSGNQLFVRLEFVAPGQTELYVFDDDDVVIDVQHLLVDSPSGAEVQAWDDLSAGIEEPVEVPVHLLAGSDADLAVRWTDSTGQPLQGAGLLTTEHDAPADVFVSSRVSGEVDVLELVVEATAAPGPFTITLSALDAPVDDLPVEIVARDEVTALLPTVQTLFRDPDTGTQGTVLITAMAGDRRLIGAEAEWFDGDGEPLGTGAVVLWEGEPGDTSDVTACLDALCETVSIAGRVTAVSDNSAPEDLLGNCSCRTSPTGAAGWLLVAGVLAQRRRRPSIWTSSSSRRR